MQLVRESLVDASFRRVVLAKPRSSASASRVTVREVMVREQLLLSVVETHTTKDVTRNLPTGDALGLIHELIGSTFMRAHLIGARENVDLSISKKGRGSLHRSTTPTDAGDVVDRTETGLRTDEPDASADDGHADFSGRVPGHDRIKRRFVQQDRAYLRELGVTDAHGRVVPAMARKWKQINKFVEILDGAIAGCPLSFSQHVRALDFGSGKGYLTFALHDHLSSTMGKDVHVTGVELRPELVDAANLAARRVHADGLDFVCGDIAETAVPTDDGWLGIMVALHACDTATDIAIHQGIHRGAQIIVCSPCCHKELRPQMKAPSPLSPVLRHGVHLGQEAEMVTDAIRALLLEANGFDTKVFEFVGLEHSSKNKMILAVRRTGDHQGKRERALREVAELKAFYGIAVHHLETLLSLSDR